MSNIIDFPKPYRENPFLENWLRYFETAGIKHRTAQIFNFSPHKPRLLPSIRLNSDTVWDTNDNSLYRNPQKKLFDELDKAAKYFKIDWMQINPVPGTLREQLIKLVNLEINKNEDKP